MPWVVRLHPDFVAELKAIPMAAQTELLAQACVLERFGPQAGRPRVDTLKGSRHANMKELRFEAAGGVWRAAFAFDQRREAALLAVGNKSAIGQSRFYRQLIDRADRRFTDHQSRLAAFDSRH